VRRGEERRRSPGEERRGGGRQVIWWRVSDLPCQYHRLMDAPVDWKQVWIIYFCSHRGSGLHITWNHHRLGITCSVHHFLKWGIDGDPMAEVYGCSGGALLGASASPDDLLGPEIKTFRNPFLWTMTLEGPPLAPGPLAPEGLLLC
jgi:hypothetical protein